MKLNKSEKRERLERITREYIAAQREVDNMPTIGRFCSREEMQSTVNALYMAPIARLRRELGLD